MKILYGVQGTGNGHLSRAMAMADALGEHPGIEVTWLITGRDNGRVYPGIGSYEWRRGLTFVTYHGRVSITGTLRENSFLRFWKDCRQLKLDGYDLVISDYEPVLSHAARLTGVPVIGIGHQCAFHYDIPLAGTGRMTLSLMRNFAPVTTPVGLHWHHFNQPLLPPMLHRGILGSTPDAREGKVLVYLPMEDRDDVIEVLRKLTNWHFWFYHPGNTDLDSGNLHLRGISTDGFREDLRTATAVICNSGFELISECLHLGKAVLAKPLFRQMEQLSNARALEILQYATVVQRIDSTTLGNWLESNPSGPAIRFPDVPARLAEWIVRGCKESVEQLSHELWAGSRETAPAAA